MRSLFNRKSHRPVYALPPGRRVYAVGDIHGRFDLLERLLAQISADAVDCGQDVETVFVGDYVDRGAGSAAVIERLAAGPDADMRWVTLRGNHDQILLDILEGTGDVADVVGSWLLLGGRETLRSYGVPWELIMGGDVAATISDLRDRVPAAHLEFLRRTSPSHRAGDYLFVHAGIRPGIAIDRQRDHDLMWIRREFLHSAHDHGCVVVHGHTPVEAVEELPNRIGIDTGAYASGRLTALVLDGASRRFLAT